MLTEDPQRLGTIVRMDITKDREFSHRTGLENRKFPLEFDRLTHRLRSLSVKLAKPTPIVFIDFKTNRHETQVKCNHRMGRLMNRNPMPNRTISRQPGRRCVQTNGSSRRHLAFVDGNRGWGWANREIQVQKEAPVLRQHQEDVQRIG